MKSPYKNINIEYWIYPDGTDFNGIEQFVDEIDKDYSLTVSKKRTDTLGGGLYDFIIKISEDLSILDLAKSYIEDGVKLYIGYNVKTIYRLIKKLFEKNQDFHPSVESISIKFKDCKITLYEIYENGIEEAFDEILEKLFVLTYSDKKRFKKIKEIHIPIFNHKDSYNLCDFRVKLEIDENMTDFCKKNYLEYWGIQMKNKKLIYDLNEEKLVKVKFYTQKSYNRLYDKSRE